MPSYADVRLTPIVTAAVALADRRLVYETERDAVTSRETRDERSTQPTLGI